MMARINLLGLVGAITGIVAIFSTWLGLGHLITFNLIDVLNDVSANGIAWYSAVLFITGTLVALLSSVGGVLQVGGVSLWWYYVLRESDKIPSKVGSYIGLISAIIVLASMVRPLGPGLMKGPFELKSRLLVFTREPPSSKIEEKEEV
jgi:hypothetical protein